MLYQNYIRVLYIDLFTKKIKFENREDLSEYIGGSGVSSKIFSELADYGAEPLAPSQPVVFAIGPMSTIFPVCTKAVCSFFSPQTGEYGESHAGGRLAMAIRLANIDAIVITGRAQSPVYITIKPDDIIFHDAEALWQLGVSESGQYMRSMAGAPGNRSIIRIGPAGANQVPTAGINVDTYRHFGRLGAGAVFGSKNLKGLVICGEKDFAIKYPAEYNKLYSEIYDKTTKTGLMAKYHELGTSKNVLPLNKINALPSYNLKQSNYEYAANISGEAFAEEVLNRKVSCSGCPIGCIHIGWLRKLFDAGYEYESTGVSYDHELVFSLGSQLGIKNTTGVLNLINETEEMGLDAISCGVILGFMSEALERGDINLSETIVELKFGEIDNYLKAIKYLAIPPNDFYREIGRGLYNFTAKKGGASYDYALQLGGLEISGYFTGPAHLIGGLTGIRHSHLDNAGYSLDQKLLKDAATLSAKTVAEKIIEEEAIRSVYTSLVICLFAREVYDLETVCRALKVIDINATPDSLKAVSSKILKNKLDIRQKMGFNLDNFPLASRYFETLSPYGLIKKEFTDEIIAHYKRLIEK
jgi:aldehyde:ferredoxin oxidoreductase